MTLPRPEYPRPQFVRGDWLCLNGPWQFELDAGDSGLERGLLERELAGRILVPFCPESALSGVGNTNFLNAVWYRRTVTIPEEWAGRSVLLHFQAVDYDATVWVNGVEVARHRGGFTPFTADLAGVAAAGETVTIVLRARDDHRQAKPLGKQSQRYANHGCHYTRTTGIWQTAWMEPVPAIYLDHTRITPDLANGMFRLEQPLRRSAAPFATPAKGPAGLAVRATLSDKDGIVCTATTSADADLAPRLDLPIPSARRRCWQPGDPHLYDLVMELLGPDGTTLDRLASYAGLRSVAIDGAAILLNGRAVFQRLVLDQGHYPGGILTAPTDDALRRDIELAQAAGFNGARLHQKVFEERFLHHADRLGYLVWGEFADWGCQHVGPPDDHIQPPATCVTQWLEALHRDYSHPSIIGWCPLNETAQPIRDDISVLDDVTAAMFLAAKAMDTTRPVLDASGYSHRLAQADVCDCHDYEQDPARFAARQAPLTEGRPFTNGPRDKEKPGPWSIPYRGQPFFVSEFGGTWWNPQPGPGDPSWGYGDRPKSIEEFYQRFEKLISVLLGNPGMFGYCYTQLTDVFQEQNGIYTFDRQEKFDASRLRRIQQRPAAIES